MSNPEQIFNATQIACLLGRSVSRASRLATAGYFGEPVVHKKRKHYRLSEIERGTGKQFSTEQIEKASKAHVDMELSETDILRGFVALFLKHRDEEWKTALREQGITKFTQPELPPEFMISEAFRSFWVAEWANYKLSTANEQHRE